MHIYKAMDIVVRRSSVQLGHVPAGRRRRRRHREPCQFWLPGTAALAALDFLRRFVLRLPPLGTGVAMTRETKLFQFSQH